MLGLALSAALALISVAYISSFRIVLHHWGLSYRAPFGGPIDVLRTDVASMRLQDRLFNTAGRGLFAALFIEFKGGSRPSIPLNVNVFPSSGIEAMIEHMGRDLLALTE